MWLPGKVGEVRVNGGCDDLASNFPEIFRCIAECDYFSGAHKGEVQRVEEKDHIFPCSKGEKRAWETVCNPQRVNDNYSLIHSGLHMCQCVFLLCITTVPLKSDSFRSRNCPSGITALAVKSGASFPIWALPAAIFTLSRPQKEEMATNREIAILHRFFSQWNH